MTTIAEIERCDFTADEIKKALCRPDNFGYFGGDERMFVTWSLGPVIQHRDSGILDRSNARVLKRELAKATEDGTIEPDSWEADEANHWAVGWVEHLNFQVLDDKGEPTRVARWLKIWFDGLSDYPVADDSDHSELETEESLSNIYTIIEDVLRRMDDAPDAKGEWADEVYRWLWDNDQSQCESRDEGAYPNEDAVKAALLALGHIAEETDDESENGTGE